MQKNIWILLYCSFCLCGWGVAQQKTVLTNAKVMPQTDLPTVSEQIFALQKENKELQKTVSDMKAQMAALQTQVNANYKVLDYSFGKLNKSFDTYTKQTPVPVAFTVVASAGNLTDAFSPASNTLPGTYYRSVVIDNEACNGNPNVVMLATLQPSGFGYNFPTGIAVQYDNKIGKWKIVINPHESNPYILGLAKPSQGSNMVSVAEYNPYQINNGDKFNVVAMK